MKIQIPPEFLLLLRSPVSQDPSFTADSYFAFISRRLVDDGFKIGQPANAGKYPLSFVASRDSQEDLGPRRRWVTGTTCNISTPEALSDFSEQATDYAWTNREHHLLGMWAVYSFALVVADDFSQELKESIRTTKPRTKGIMIIEFPVLVSLKESKLYFFEKSLVYGGLTYVELRRWANKMVGFETPPPKP
ncbi:MAG TPA: hypothetical protein VMS77_06120 [Conexivisphaerales archaeon]|nr:hypothetical protein [Conexivisphaerales archaeon]